MSRHPSYSITRLTFERHFSALQHTWKLLKTLRLGTYFPVDVGVTAAVIAILVSVSREPVDDFLVLTPLTVLLSITADVLSGGGKTLVFTINKNNKNKKTFNK